MKAKVTRKDVYNWHSKVIRMGYCAAQYLLYYEDAVGYNSGVYGWNYDVYSIGGTAICTGYRPIGEQVDYALLNEYEVKAEVIVHNYKLPYDEAKDAVKALLREFLEKC